MSSGLRISGDDDMEDNDGGDYDGGGDGGHGGDDDDKLLINPGSKWPFDYRPTGWLINWSSPLI